MPSSLGVRRGLTSAKRKLTVLLNDSDRMILGNNFGESDIKIQFQKLSKILDKYKTLTDQLMDLVNKYPDEDETVGPELEEHMDQCLVGEEILCKLEQMVGVFSKEEEMQQARQIVKLPKLEVAKFYGDIKKWPEFWDSFTSAVDSNVNMSKVDKLNYLKSFLREDALHCISGLALTNVNYEVAVNLLKDRFGKIDVIKSSLYDELRLLPSAKDQTKELRKTLDKIETTLRSLESLGEDISHNFLVPTIAAKFPPAVVLKLEEEKDVSSMTVQEIRKKLGKIVTARENLDARFGYRQVGSSREGIGNSLRGSHNYKQAYSTTESLNAIEARKCRFCDGKHWTDECFTFKSIEDRKNAIKGACYICLSQSHSFKQCKVNKPCYYCKKYKHHHRSLCPVKFGAKSKEQSSETAINLVGILESESEEDKSEIVNLQTAIVEINNKETGIIRKFRALLDSGSQRTYISDKAAKVLGLEKKDKEHISVFSFGSNSPKIFSTATVVLLVKLRDGREFEMKANVVPTIVQEYEVNPVVMEVRERFPDLKFAEGETGFAERGVDILIGNGYYFDLIGTEKLEVSKGLHLVSSKLGWILSGRGKRINCHKVSSMSFSTWSKDLDYEFRYLDKPDYPVRRDCSLAIEKIWNLENIGIRETPMEVEDDVAIEAFNQSITMIGNRYWVSWPWREYPPELPENHYLALARLKSLFRNQDLNLLKRYDGIIQDQLQENIIELVNKKTITGEIKHYLPHHPVMTPQKTTTKVRIVYDASARAKRSDKSLNDCLLRGRILMEDLCALLVRFRMGEIALVGDIEKAFLQIGLHYKDRDVTRFLWVKDIKKQPVDTNLIELRFTRVAFGIISSPFLLNATIQFHLKAVGDDVAQNLADNVYVDNALLSTNEEQKAVHMYNRSKEIFKLASMNIREFSCNSPEVIKEIKEDDLAKDITVGVLGLSWDTKSDTLKIKASEITDISLMITKRSVLKYVSNIFDPIGFFVPVTLTGKIFIRDLWIEKINWDEKLSEENLKKWKEIYLKIEAVKQIQITRWIGWQGDEEIDIVTFCDASLKAYSAVCYLRFKRGDRYHVQLCMAKARLAPIKGVITIPRLELLGVLIGVRCMKFIRQSLKAKIRAQWLWTDSKCVLNWINSTKPLPLFIERRVKEINSSRDISFRFISGTDNVADIATRGCSAKELEGYKKWWNGPDWLELEEVSWPKWAVEVEIGENRVEDDIDIECSTEKVTLNCLEQKINTPFQINLEKYSKYRKLLRVTGYCLRFIKNLRNENLTNLKINESSETMWVKYIQAKYCGDILEDIKKGRANLVKQQLGLFLDVEGIIRCSGRIQNSNCSYNRKFPILLPGKNYFSKLIILYFHEINLHAGVTQTLAEIRGKFWIPRGRACVFWTLKICNCYKRLEGGEFKLPQYPPLPQFRVEETLAFKNVGLDYFGPLYFKFQTINNKCWVCLYTCLVTRAVHLEIVYDMTAVEFLASLRRFISRRGVPKLILSDNARQFRLTSTVINERGLDMDVTDENTREYIDRTGITWKFTTESAPWTGGVYERMVGLVKRCLKRVVGRKQLTLSQLNTLLAEVEAVVNSRPLTYVGSEIGEQVLRPRDFLGIQGEVEILEVQDNQIKITTTRKQLIENWKKGQKILERFWQIWKKEYLTKLRELKKVQHRQGSRVVYREPKVGEVVLLGDHTPRQTWKMARVEEVVRGADGQVRTAKVKVAGNTILHRAVSALYPLEMAQEDGT